MRYLAIDLGGKRTGVALGDDDTGMAGPLTVVETASDELRLAELVKLVAAERPDGVVVGLPLNMDDTPGPAAEKAKQFASLLAGRLSTETPVYLHDERLSSADADDALAQSGFTHGQKKARRDALAATAILQRFLRDVAPRLQKTNE